MLICCTDADSDALARRSKAGMQRQDTQNTCTAGAPGSCSCMHRSLHVGTGTSPPPCFCTRIWQQPRRSPDLGGCNQEEGARTDSKVQLYSNAGTNAVQRTEPLSEYSRLCALLVPLCMPRAVEETFYGPAQVSLATAPYVRPLPCSASVQALAGKLLSLGSALFSLATSPCVRPSPACSAGAQAPAGVLDHPAAMLVLLYCLWGLPYSAWPPPPVCVPPLPAVLVHRRRLGSSEPELRHLQYAAKLRDRPTAMLMLL